MKKEGETSPELKEKGRRKETESDRKEKGPTVHEMKDKEDTVRCEAMTKLEARKKEQRQKRAKK